MGENGGWTGLGVSQPALSSVEPGQKNSLVFRRFRDFIEDVDSISGLNLEPPNGATNFRIATGVPAAVVRTFLSHYRDQIDEGTTTHGSLNRLLGPNWRTVIGSWLCTRHKDEFVSGAME